MTLEENPVLSVALEAAVPLAIMEFRDLDDGTRMALAREYGQHVASHGDALMYGGKKGAAAAAFAALAKGLALLAYQPGGVTFAGYHWCTNHVECTAAMQAAEMASAGPL